MSDLDTTTLKLQSTATGGGEAAQSAYYRRLLSAGYKGFLQGSIGGGALYGLFGLIIGGLVVTPLAMGATISVGVAASLAAAAAGIGILKGSVTFGNIGSTAAINAESADLSEQRRYLLDRYYDLPEGPEGDREAEAIKQELLNRQTDVGRPPFFHWKTVVIGATVGVVIALGAAALLSFGAIAPAALTEIFGLKLGTAITGLATTTLTAIGAAAGALGGASIGVDRYYIRKWFDHTEGVIHSSSHQETALMARKQQIERIREAAREDEQTKFQLRNGALGLKPANDSPTEITPPKIEEPVIKAPETKPENTKGVASLDKPSTHHLSEARYKGLLEIQKAMRLPVV